VSEAVYPADILSDSALMASSIQTKGAWLWTLLLLWRDKTYKITDTREGFARLWGCSVNDVEAILAELEMRQVCDMSHDVPKMSANVTLTCRRLERRCKSNADAALRKQRQRDRDRSHTDVPPKKVPPSSSSSFSSSSSKKLKALCLAIKEAWNKMAKVTGIPVVNDMSEKRKKAVSARMKTPNWTADWKAALDRIPTCPFLVGDNDRGWTANIDWFLKPDTVLNITEGKYSNKKKDEPDDPYR